MAANLQTIQSKDIEFTHNSISMVVGFRYDDLDNLYMTYCGKKQGDQFDAQIIFGSDLSWIEQYSKTYAEFINESVLPLLNEKIVEKYGAFSGGQDTELWQKLATFCQENLVFNPASGFELK